MREEAGLKAEGHSGRLVMTFRSAVSAFAACFLFSG